MLQINNKMTAKRLRTTPSEIDKINKQIFDASKKDSLYLQNIIDNIPIKYRSQINPDGHLSDYGSTALIFASLQDKGETIRILLDLGANPNATNHSGFTPLMLASMYGNPSIILLLLNIVNDNNPIVKLDIKDLDGKTALDFALDIKPEHSEKLKIKKSECISLLKTIILITNIKPEQIINLIIKENYLFTSFNINSWVFRLQNITQKYLYESIITFNTDAIACFTALYMNSGQAIGADRFANLRWLTGGANIQPRSGAYGPRPIRYRIVGYLVNQKQSIRELFKIIFTLLN